MHRYFFLFLWLAIYAGNAWTQKPDTATKGAGLTTPWTSSVSTTLPLPEYPRPQMVRGNWKNLNGQWEYAVLPKKSARPSAYQGSILVPFAIESSLSGVKKTVGRDSVLWYKETFSLPASMKGKTILLHFGAVDWEAEVYVNGKKMGMHQGGYDPFSFDITTALDKKKDQQIELRVWDPSDEGPQPRGKQVRRPNGIWYTPVTGIWQTVWIEAVAPAYIISTRQTPDVDHQSIRLSTQVVQSQPNDRISFSVWEGEKKIAEQTASPNSELQLTIPQAKLWSPDNPFLYDLKITLTRNGKTMDEVRSYFAMRKISTAADNNGTKRMLLNNRFLFQYGPLDQGWWPVHSTYRRSPCI